MFAGRPWRKLDGWMGLIWEDHTRLELLRCLGRCCSNQQQQRSKRGRAAWAEAEGEALPGCSWQGNVPAPASQGGGDTQGNELSLWAWGCRGSVSRHVCVSLLPVPVLFPCVLPVGIPGVQLGLALPSSPAPHSSARREALGSPHRESEPGGESVGVSPVSPVCHCPGGFGFGFVAGGPRQHVVRRSALTKPGNHQRTPFCRGLTW